MYAITLGCALVAALVFLRSNALEYQIYNLTFCPEIPGKRAYKAEMHQRIKDDLQEFTGNLTMFKEFGNDNTFVVEAFRIKDSKEVRLITYKGKRACAAMLSYGGAPYQKLARMANVENPTKCPIAKKNYFISDYIGVRVGEVSPQLTRLAPKGKFRVKTILTDKRTGNVDFCAQFFGEKY